MILIWIMLLLLCIPIAYQNNEDDFKHDISLKSDLKVMQKAPNSNPDGLVPSSSDLIERSLLGSVETALSTLLKPQIKRRKRNNCKKFKNFVGSNLFDGDRKACFSPEDINVLTARREFELTMIPKNMTPTILDDKSVSVIMRYFCYGHLLIRRMKDCSTSRVLKKAFFDTFGAFMHHYLLPVVKMSFYFGNVQLKTVSKVVDYYQKCRFFLNTNGNGWRSPLHIPMDNLKNVTFKPMSMKKNFACDIESNVDYCSGLDLVAQSSSNDIVDDNMIVALPKIELEDTDGYLGNIWFPYSGKSTFSFRSCASAFALVEFYKKVSICYWHKQLPQDTFDIKFKQWIAENILVHIYDEEFYPSLGGLISLYKHLEKSEKGCKRKTTQDASEEEDNSNIIDKRESDNMLNALKQRRRTSKFMDLESKTKQMSSSSDCELNWLRQINEIPPDGNTKNRKKGKSSKKGKDKEKSSSKFKWGKWLDWFKSLLDSDSESSNKSGWWKWLKKIMKYIILVLIVLILLCIICKVISLLLTALCGVGGSIGGDCFGVLGKLIFEFFRKLMQVFRTLCKCFFPKMLKRSDSASKDSQKRSKEIIEKTSPEIRIETQYKSSKTNKSKKSQNTPSMKSNQPEIFVPSKASKKPDSLEMEMCTEDDIKPCTTSKREKTNTSPSKKSNNPQILVAQASDRRRQAGNADQNKDEKLKKHRRRAFERRQRGGQSYVPNGMSTDSSPNSKGKMSWQTFYDF